MLKIILIFTLILIILMWLYNLYLIFIEKDINEKRYFETITLNITLSILLADIEQYKWVMLIFLYLIIFSIVNLIKESKK